MRRKRPFKCGRAIAVLAAAGSLGYLTGGWHAADLRSDPSPAELIAHRFPEEWSGSSVAAVAAFPAVTAVAVTAAAKRDAELALFSPEPMVPQAQAEPHVVAAPAVQTAAADVASSSPRETTERRPARPAATAPRPATAAKPVAVRRPPERPGYLLDDAQIASIKARLNLTPDQEQMWPAVEAALRNIAYTRAQPTRGQVYSADAAQAAAVDPDAVQDLKSAATPLILSFSDEQKEEVRNLAHVMGLDQLAAQF